MRGWISITVAVAATLVLSAPSHAGTPGPTVSLGKSKGLEYMRAKFEGVLSQAGAPAH